LRTTPYLWVVAYDIKPQHEDPMPFKPNYGRERAERQKAARVRSEEKQRKKEEKAAQRKAERAAGEPTPDDKKES
jgi:hypothetical protein